VAHASTGWLDRRLFTGSCRWRRHNAGGGLLPKPELLSAGGSGKRELVYFKPGLNRANDNTILLAPVAIISDSMPPLATTSAEQREVLANTYYSYSIPRSASIVT
jgi:hypothetical protein